MENMYKYLDTTIFFGLIAEKKRKLRQNYVEGTLTVVTSWLVLAVTTQSA